MGGAESCNKNNYQAPPDPHAQSLIPGLPNDLAMECLLRVPYQFHWAARSVCRNWRALLSHPSFYGERRRVGTAEDLVFLVQPQSTPTPLPHPAALEAEPPADTVKDKERDQPRQHPPRFGVSIFNLTYNTWQRFRPDSDHPEGVPMFCHCVALPSRGKVLLLGGWDPKTLEPLPDVYVLDLAGAGAGGEWRRGAPMTVARSFFACAAVGPASVCVAGGHDGQKNALRSAEAYDADRDEWRALPSMAEERDECQGLAWEGDSRFWVVSGYGTDSQGRFRSDAECYDPATASWTKVEGAWPFATASPRGATAAGGQHKWWWFLDEEQHQGEVKEYEKEDKGWKAVSSVSLPKGMVRASKCITNIGFSSGNGVHQRIFVMSSGGGDTGLESCGECDGEGTFVMERADGAGNSTTKWLHIHTPLKFSGFPCSSSYISI